MSLRMRVSILFGPHDSTEAGLGRPYHNEVAELPETYAWACQQDITTLVSWISALGSKPLVAIGSGGSLSTATFATTLHSRFTGGLATTLTPLESQHALTRAANAGVMLLSAAGSNRDVLSAFRHVVGAEPRHLLAICARRDSKLASLCAAHELADLYEFDHPSGKDGHLATNSLVATACLILRASAEACGRDLCLPDSAAALLSLQATDWEGVIGDIAQSAAAISGKRYLLVLHGPGTRAAAWDIESKCSEAGLAAVQVCDLRNFAHGRHHWLAKHGQETGVLVLTTSDDRRLAKRTLALLPTDVTAVERHFAQPDGVNGLAALLYSVVITGIIGQVKSIDPGRPGVPPFGRRIYHLTGCPAKSPHGLDDEHERVAIERKIKRPTTTLTANSLASWRLAYKKFHSRIVRTRFGSIVLDYDGTLCSPRERLENARAEIGKELSRLVRGGIRIGIATGRGRSARKALQACLPEHQWKEVYIGYGLKHLANADSTSGTEVHKAVTK
ncbi:MAG: hypothetical protein QM754_17505 [Tepidisphaeraceae bacterium]